ncbi:MAG: hypothetical protein J07HX64_00532 [halophilic archaeon J07HX64]|nr:MAG: hypothetical protein J07HX64_00532 [halophilic archaeon J07HX64]
MPEFTTEGASIRRMSALYTDERAIEGLPVRLVIAVTVGVAALGMMLGLLAEFDDPGTTEVTVEASDELIVLEGGDKSVMLRVVTEDGQPVEGAQLLVTEGSLPLADGPVDLQTGPDSHEVTVGIGTISGVDGSVTPAFRDGQSRGTLEIEVVPPSGTGLRDERGNPELVVVGG